MDFTEELRKLGAREFQIVALSADEERAMAALAEAERRGVEHPIAYALTLFDNPAWTPKPGQVRHSTNLAVERECGVCGGDRFVLVSTRRPEQTNWMREHGIEPSSSEVFEEYAPCAACNAEADTTFWRTDGTRARTEAR